MIEEHIILEQLVDLLNKAGAHFTILHHDENIASAKNGASQGLGQLSEMAPTLILKTNRGFYAAIIRGDTRLSYKKIKKNCI